jgi:hypothetical protein
MIICEIMTIFDSVKLCEFHNGIAQTLTRSNSHVSKILPVTTFRTIDLGGKKNPDRLFC